MTHPLISALYQRASLPIAGRIDAEATARPTADPVALRLLAAKRIEALTLALIEAAAGIRGGVPSALAVAPLRPARADAGAALSALMLASDEPAQDVIAWRLDRLLGERATVAELGSWSRELRGSAAPTLAEVAAQMARALDDDDDPLTALRALHERLATWAQPKGGDCG